MRLATFIALTLLITGDPARADRRTWRVQSGDALSVLAARFDVSVEQLRQWNDLEGDSILVGQELVISDREHPTYEIKQGETLSHVAQHFGTTVAEIVELNPGLNPDRVRSGARIRVQHPAGRRIEYRVRRGEVLSRIAARHRVRVRDLLSWNPGLRRDRLREGTSLLIWSEIPPSISESVGAPNRGRLRDAEQLPAHPAYVIRDAARAWGTLETVLWIQDAFDAVRAEFPDAPRVRIHDISRRRGGFLVGHRSHQSGRDVDISLYHRGCGPEGCPFRRLNEETLDARRQWGLLRQWLEAERVDAIFLDYSLQKPLFEEARRQGATGAQLHRWFQYPHGRMYPLGLIRHFPKHRDHAHVRFKCPDTDENCRG